MSIAPSFHRMCRVAASATAFAAAAAPANDMRVHVREADLIVVATTKSVADGYTASSDTGGPWTVSRIELLVLRYIKGSGPADIAIPVPTDWTYREGVFGLGPQAFEVTPGKTNLWYLQKADSNHRFARRREEIPPNRGWWEAPGFDYAPMSMYGHLAAQVPLASTEFDSSLPPLVAICDLLAHSAAARDSHWRTYFQALEQLTFDERYIGYETKTWGDDKKAAKKWFAERWPQIYVPHNDVEHLRDLALRLAWGQPQYEDEFMALYFGVPNAASQVDFPSLRKVENMIAMTEKCPYGQAHGWFVSLRQAPKVYKRRILDIAIKRIGEDHMQDAGILECISGLYDKPELLPNNPKNDYKVPADLSAKLDAVRKLAQSR